MKGGTTFHFVTGGIDEALRRAREGGAARTCGWTAVSRPYGSTCARLVDELHLTILPVLLGSGESLFEGIDLGALGYQVADHVPSAAAMHVVLRRSNPAQCAG
jgi:dihydrofolate reductase